MRLPDRVTLVEVGPRDGLQNETLCVPLQTKVEFIDRLSACGCSVIEAGSLVSPKHVPQMADSDTVFRRIERLPGVHYPLLVPNQQGLERALRVGASHIAVFVSASETFSRHNVRCGVEEHLAKLAGVCRSARARGLQIRGYVSCVLGCPYEGDVDVSVVAEIASKLLRMGCSEIALGDTIGVGTPGKAQALIDRVARQVPVERLAVHFHDTYGQALANIFAVLPLGVRVIDGSIAGLGGCPYAPGASGNVASEDVLYMLNGLGIDTGVDLNALIATSQWIMHALDRKPGSKVTLARTL